MKFLPQFSEIFQELLKSLEGKKIAVIGHLRPDGDCISSQFALADALSETGKFADVICLNNNTLPYLYENFAHGRTLLDAKTFTDTSYEIITVDCADYLRTGEEFSKRFPLPLACIDHHISNAPYAKVNILDTTASATAEMIAGLLLDAGLGISKINADRLFMGLATDTRQFTTASTTLKSFKIAAKLVELGADPALVAKELYQRERFGKLKLLAYYLQNLEMRFDGRVCMGVLPLDIFERTGSTKEDTDGLVDYARSIDGVEIAIIIELLEDGLKGSLRAKDQSLCVNEIAGIFGGGGHKAAAGFSVKNTNLTEFLPKLLGAIEKKLYKKI